MNSKIQAAEENLIHVYNRFPIALDHGKGMYLYDTCLLYTSPSPRDRG